MVYKNIRFSAARFHTSAMVSARNRIPTNIKLRNPIVPTINNLKIRDDHPLYQFFSERKLFRDPEDVMDGARHWEISELRRKSFEDLHKLWYVILKERNILARETKLADVRGLRASYQFDNASKQLYESMWRIKYVLHERLQSHEAAKEHFNVNRDKYLEEFSEEYLQSDVVETEEWFDKLERLQFAFFGIPNEISMDLDINVDYILGIRYIGELIFNRFNDPASTGLESLRDITEYYAIFEEEPTLQGFQSGVSKIKEYRESNVTIPKNKDITVVKALIKSRIDQIDNQEEE